MRFLFALMVVALCATTALASDIPPTFGPTDGSKPNGMCQLTSLRLDKLSFYPTFSSDTYQYTCSCGTVVNSAVTVQTMDPGSMASLIFNGVPMGYIGTDGSTPSMELQFQNGPNTIEVDVNCNSDCNYKYVITCTKTPPTGPEVIGDPQFVGLKGQSYQVHGVSGEIYNIVSDPSVQYNSRFVFLNSGDCPVINGKKAKGCFSHAGSYLGELGLKTASNEKIHIVSGPAASGFAEVSVNGKQLAVGESVTLADNLGFVALNGTHQVSTQIGKWYFEFENSDMYINQKVRVTDVKKIRSHGLLGQTWRSTTYPNSIKYVQGKVDDYVIRSGDIFGDDFVYNTHN